MDGDRRGEIRVRQVVPVTRVKMPGKVTHSKVPRTTRERYGVKITIDPARMAASFEIWVVAEACDSGRVELGVYVPHAVQVERAVPVS